MADLGLALSGGGFRATLFHLGVVRYLRDTGALHRVSDIASVSGGSILAAHMVLNWNRYTGTPEAFEEAAAEIVRFVQFDVRNHIMRRLALQAPLRWFARLTRRPAKSFTANALLERYYRDFLYGDRCMYELPDHPALHILTTSISHGGLSVFNRNGLFIQQRGKDGAAVYDHTPNLMASIPRVVAASSAFPAFFPPVEIGAEDLGIREGQTPTEFFTDGGVYDNLGLRAFVWLQQHAQFECILVSDAGKPFQILSDASLGFVGRSMRATDILWDRVGQLERENFGNRSGFVFIPITESVEVKQAGSALHPVVQAEVQSIRTDLDRFSDLEINALTRHGYAVARKFYQPNSADSTAGSDASPPWSPVHHGGTEAKDADAAAGPSAPTRAARQLRRSGRRRIFSTFLDLRDWPTYLYLALALLIFVYAPIQLYELQKRARQQADIIEAITRGNPDIHQVLELVGELPQDTWLPDPVEEHAEVSTRDYSAVELLTHNRILDLRRAPLAGSSQPAAGYVHLYDRLTLKLSENDPSVEQIILPYFITGEGVEFRHTGSSTAHTIAKITQPVELYGVERTLYEVAHDVSEVPPGVSVNVGLEMRAKVNEDVSNAGFVIQLKTDLLSIWLLFPGDRPYRTYSLTRYPADRSLPPEAVEARYIIDHPYGSLIGWSVVNPTLDYIYDCRWTME